MIIDLAYQISTNIAMHVQPITAMASDEMLSRGKPSSENG
jgi:hypothetical protein